MLGELMFIMQPQDIQPEVALLNSTPNPAGGGLRGGLRAGGMTGAAIHFIGNGQHNVIRGDRRGAIFSDQPHHRIRILLVRVIVRRNRNSLGAPPIDWRRHARRGLIGAFKQHALRRIAHSGHAPPGQSAFRAEGGSKKVMRIGVVITLAHGGGIEGAIGIRRRLIGDRVAAAVGDEFATDDELRFDRVIWR